MIGFGMAYVLASVYGAAIEPPTKISMPANAPNALVAAAADAAPATAPAPVAAPASVPAAVPPAPVAIEAKPKPALTLTAKIDLTSQTVTIAEHGKQIHTWKISSGTRDFQTPTGTFRPQWMAKMWFSKKYDDAPMPHSVFFKDGVALHATQATHALGRPASHGCVRLAPANAATFYALVQKHGMTHTQIQVFGTPKFAPQVARAAPALDSGEAIAAAQRARQGRYATAGYYQAQPQPSTSGSSWFGASPYRYPGDPAPVRQIYRYGTR